MRISAYAQQSEQHSREHGTESHWVLQQQINLSLAVIPHGQIEPRLASPSEEFARRATAVMHPLTSMPPEALGFVAARPDAENRLPAAAPGVPLVLSDCNAPSQTAPPR